MPQSIYELNEKVETDDPVDRREEQLLSIIPKERQRSYEMRDIVRMISDKDSFFEITKGAMFLFIRMIHVEFYLVVEYFV